MAINVKSNSPQSIAEGPVKAGGSEAMALLAAMEKNSGTKVWLPGNKIPKAERIPTGMVEFDAATGGGFPCGRVSLVYGKEASDKTNITLRAARSVQRRKGRIDNKVAFVDVEGTFDGEWAAAQGVDTSALIVVKPGYGEQASDAVDGLMQASDIGLVILDSVAVMSKSKEIEGSAEDQSMGGASAVLMNQLMRKLAFTFSRESARGHSPALILINQPRLTVGQMHPSVYLPGGKLQIFQSSLSIKVSGKKRIEKAIDPSRAAWLDVEVEIMKSKIGICRSEFKYSACLLPHDGLNVGDTDAWQTVMTTLKSSEHIKKVPQGWQYAGKVYPTLVPIAEMYANNPTARAAMQKQMVDVMMGTQVLVDKDMKAIDKSIEEDVL